MPKVQAAHRGTQLPLTASLRVRGSFGTGKPLSFVKHHWVCADLHLQSFAFISDTFRLTRVFAAPTACTPGAQVALRLVIAQCVATVSLAGFCYCGRELTDAGWHIVDIQIDRVDLSDRSVEIAIWDAMRRRAVGLISPVGEAFLGFSTL
ncbi:hypothetical protein [Hydrogenophaga sp.]|uniref:hypothetical protein n=1 Tax=Hydrogenophaga sp. TaxID=1904254 RepID=UPI00272ADFD0|nr:hypothetical protein [Hydrogenophaga sp.]